MMNLREHELIVLMEECAEVIEQLTQVQQRASKQLRFGDHEIQPLQSAANRTRLRDELMDLMCCVRYMEARGTIVCITNDDLNDWMMSKRPRIEKMRKLSFMLGTLDTIEHRIGVGDAV